MRDVLQDLLVTIEKVVAKGSSSCEEMSVDDDEDEKDLSSSSTTEKRRRRRRGNSCTATENEDNKHHKVLQLLTELFDITYIFNYKIWDATFLCPLGCGT